MRYSIGEVSRRFGIAVSALRYYDEIGLLPPAGRRGTVREYGRDELRRLALIQFLHRDALIPLADTAAILSGDATGREVISGTIRAAQEQIDRLRDARRLLEHMLTCPREEPIRDCPVLRGSLDEAVTEAVGDA